MEKNSGLTILELLMAMVVVALLLAVGTPSLRQFISRNAVIADTNDLVTALNLARNEAISRGVPVSLCPSVNGTACSAANPYQTGWIVFADPNGNLGVDATEAVLRAQIAPRRSQVAAGGLSGGATFSAKGLAAAGANGTATICRAGFNRCRQVTLSQMGRIQTVDIANPSP